MGELSKIHANCVNLRELLKEILRCEEGKETDRENRTLLESTNLDKIVRDLKQMTQGAGIWSRSK